MLATTKRKLPPASSEDFAMPKVRTPKPSDGRTLVDRLLDRIKNNRVAAVVIIACLGIGALASLTDSTRKLTDALSSLTSKSVAGEWKSHAAAFYPSFGQEFMRLHLQEPTADQLVGFVQFSGNEEMRPRIFPILEGKRSGKSLRLSFDSGDRVREIVVGDLAGSELRLVYQREGRGAVSATARHVVQATQLVDGRFGILYKRKEYPDHRTACLQLLKDLDPPEIYKQSEPPDEYGNVHCVGQHADGRGGFDMFQNSVRQQLICPPNSRGALVDGKTPKSAKGCECDGELIASGSQCVPRA
ncbi:hypothetical protein LJR130_006225 [Variovorax sp. LjRoot130]|uniref:hypothetical protein n=1 Tax=Variovorax sp. LjRoot290 TaxID=3342316 RepID=UPI003ED1472C